MILDDVIKHCEEVAEEKENLLKFIDGEIKDPAMIRCKECASEHRQLAEWLRELKVKRQIITNVKEQCKVWKRNNFQNRDYGVGFISALSNIEGLIAYTEEQLEVNADECNSR